MPLYQKHSLCFVTAVFKICFAYIDGGGEINPVSMFGMHDPKFNVIVKAAFVKKIKIRIRLQDRIDIWVTKSFFRMPSGKGCPYESIKFPVRQVTGRKDAVAIDIFHADYKFDVFPDQMCKGIETFISPVSHKDSGNRIFVAVNHDVQCGTLMEFLFALNKKIAVSLIGDVIKGIDMNGIITFFAFMDKGSFIRLVMCNVYIRAITCKKPVTVV